MLPSKLQRPTPPVVITAVLGRTGTARSNGPFARPTWCTARCRCSRTAILFVIPFPHRIRVTWTNVRRRRYRREIGTAYPRCPRYLMVCILYSVTNAFRHPENRFIQHSTHVPLWLTVAEIGRTLSKPVKFVLADKKSEHNRTATPFGKRNKNRKSKTSPLPRIMNHMVERDSQNDVPEEMDITEGMKPLVQQLLLLCFVYWLIHIALIIRLVSPR